MAPDNVVGGLRELKRSVAYASSSFTTRPWMSVSV